MQLHDRVIGQFGGKPGVRDRVALASSLAQPKVEVFGTERFKSVHDKAGAYCYFISQNQPFFDGNKRAGFLAALAFLLLNNVNPRIDNHEAYRLLIAVANRELSLDEFLIAFRSADKSQSA